MSVPCRSSPFVSVPCRLSPCRVRDINKWELISGRSKSPICTVSDESECESGCTDTECTGNLCNVNLKIGHKKCYKHIKEQRGWPCNSVFPCHRCRKRLKCDTNGKFAKYLDQLSKDRKRQARKRASMQSMSNSSKLTKQVSLGKCGSFMSIFLLLQESSISRTGRKNRLRTWMNSLRETKS